MSKPSYEQLETQLRELQDLLEGLRKVREFEQSLRRLVDEAQEERQVLNAIMKFVPTGITIADAETMTVTRSSSYGAAVSLTAEEDWNNAPLLVALAKLGLRHTDGTAAEIEEMPLYRATVFGEIISEEEWLLDRIDGKTIPLIISAGPVFDEEGHIKGGIAAWGDISQRKKMEQALRESEENFRSIAENANALLAVVQNGKLVYLNPFGVNLIGYSLEELASMNYFDFITPEFREVVFRRMESLFADEAAAERTPIELSITNRAGELIWLEIAPALITYCGSPAVSGFATNITERKRAQQALYESERQFRRVTEVLPQLVWTAEPDGTIDYANPRWEEFTGLDRKTQLDKWPSVIHPDNRQLTVDSWKSALRTASPFQTELQLLRKDGVYRWHIARGIPLRDESGRVIKWFGAITDIHDYKEQQQTLERLTGELTRSNRELEQFAYIASHDLQEPLRMVTGYLDLIQSRYSRKLDEDARDFIKFAIGGAERMKQLINDLLLYSRTGTSTAPFEQVSLESVLDHVLTDMSQTIAATQAEIKYEPLPSIYGVETQLRQLFMNLIANAIKFRKEEPPKIRIAVKKIDHQWLFSVQDNGIGFKQEMADRIFDLFQRLHMHRDYPGTGLGLAICKKIVERHGGAIWVESHPDIGSTFHFTLPEKGD